MLSQVTYVGTVRAKLKSMMFVLTTSIKSPPSRSANETFMHRMNPIRYGITTAFSRQLSHASSPRPLLPSVSRSLHTSSGSPPQQRSSSLNAYTGSTIALSIITLGVYWVYSTSEKTKPTILDGRRFQPFAIISKEPVASSSSIFTLRPGSQPVSDPYAPLWATGIWSVEFKQPQLQIARSYTPLPPSEIPVVPGDLRFLIRREHHGEVSTYLDRLRTGAIVDIRGPRVEYEVPEDVSEVLFLAGGTGIAPALQVAYLLLEKRVEDDNAGKGSKIHILWANRKRDDCAGGKVAVKSGWWTWSRPTLKDQSPNRVVQELQLLENKYEGKFKIDYMVDEEDSFIGKSDVLKITNSGVELPESLDHARPGKKLLFISGPDGFVEYYAGRREWEDGKLGQGPLGGLLGGLQLNDWTVIKL